MRGFLLLAALTLPFGAQALVLISNYPPTNNNDGSLSLHTSRQKVMGFVMPATDYVLLSIKVRLRFNSGAVAGQNPIVAIRDTGNANGPGGFLHTLTAPGGYATGDADYTFTSTGYLLLASKKYWVSVRGAATISGMDWRGSISPIVPTGLASHQGSMSTSSNGADWQEVSTLNTYEISVNPVPEPATLIGLGVGALVLLRRKRSRSQ